MALKLNSVTSTALAAVLMITGNSQASVISTYFGFDPGLGEGTRLAAIPMSLGAQANFLSGLAGVGTETFESFADGTSAPLGVNFGVAGLATLTGTGSVNNVPVGTNGAGRFPISGNNYWEGSGAFSIEFSTKQAAMGFFATDVGDFNGQVTIQLFDGMTPLDLINIGNPTNVTGGSALYFGFITDGASEFDRITFGNTQAGNDFFGFDDFTIATRQQVGGTVPEPTSIAVWSLLGGLGFVRARRVRK